MRLLKNYLSDIGLPFAFLLFMFLLNPFNQGALFVYPMIGLFLFQKKFLLQSLDLNFVLLVLLSLIYALFYLFDPIGGIQFFLYYAFFPPFFYLFGKYLVKDMNTPSIIFHLLVTIGFVFSSSALISVFINFVEGGFTQFDRSLPYFWTGQLFSATKMGAFFTLNMCLPALLIANQRRSALWLRIVALAVFILTLICVIRLGSRTQLAIMLITSLVSFVYVVPRQSFQKNVILFVIMSGLIFYVFRNVSFDLNADWLTTFAGRMENGPGEVASGGGRTERWVKSLHNLWEKPLGWSVNEFGHSHNLWLDVLRVSGVITFVLLIFFSIRAFSIIPKTMQVMKEAIFFNVLVLVYGIAFFLLFLVEPIFEGAFSFFLLFCLFTGILIKYNKVHGKGN